MAMTYPERARLWYSKPEKRSARIAGARAWQRENHQRHLANRRAWRKKNWVAIKVGRALGMPMTQARLILEEKRRN